MRTLDATIAVLMLAAPVFAQNPLYMPATFAPDLNELNKWDSVPLMVTNARVQVFYDRASAGATNFTARDLSLRYDGPIPPVGPPGPFTIGRFRLQVGSSSVAQPGAVFARNLSQPLTTVLDNPLNFLPDGGTSVPAPWGGPGGSLVFPLQVPVRVDVPAGGWFIVEIGVQNNSNNNAAHALLDGAEVPGGPIDGSASSTGAGCPIAAGANPAAIATSGTHAPGAAHSVHGSELGPNASVVAMLGFSDTQSSFGPLPFVLAGTTCSIQQSWDLGWVLQADALGTIPAFAPGTMVPVPPVQALANRTIFEQLGAIAPGANPWGVVLSDKRIVTLGTLTAPNIGIYQVRSSQSFGAAVADSVRAFAYALRVGT